LTRSVGKKQSAVTYEDQDSVRITLPRVDEFLVVLFGFPERARPESRCDLVLVLVRSYKGQTIK
jgi:hypothetical protein